MRSVCQPVSFLCLVSVDEYVRNVFAVLDAVLSEGECFLESDTVRHESSRSPHHPVRQRMTSGIGPLFPESVRPL